MTDGNSTNSPMRYGTGLRAIAAAAILIVPASMILVEASRPTIAFEPTEAVTRNLVVRTPAGLGQGITQFQPFYGTQVGNATANFFGITDNAKLTGSGFGAAGLRGWSFQHDIGTGFAGGRNTFAISAYLNGADDGTSTTPNHVAFAPAMTVNAGQGGTSTRFTGGSRGAFCVENSVLRILAGSNLQATTIAEDDIALCAACSASYKIGRSVVELADDKMQGTEADIGFDMSAQPGAIGWKHVIDVGPANGAYPYNSSSTIWSMSGAGAADLGVDLSGNWNGTNDKTGTQFGSCAYKFKQFCVDNYSNIRARGFVVQSSLKLPIGDTVASLPRCTKRIQGLLITVSDADTSLTYNAALKAGGKGEFATIPAFCNGAHWTAH